MFYLLNGKRLPWLITVKGVLKKKTSLTEIYSLSRTNRNYPRCHLDSRQWRRALSRVPTYPRQLTYAHTSQNTWPKSLTAPSAVHLTTCFLPDSQHRRLSVKASLPLSPLQRFGLLKYDRIIASHYYAIKIFCALWKNICYLPVPNRMEIVVPLFSSLSTEILPWWYCTACLTMDRPRPVPPDCLEWLLSTR